MKRGRTEAPPSITDTRCQYLLTGYIANIKSKRCLQTEDVIWDYYKVLVFDSIDNAIGDIAVVDGSVKRAPVAIQIMRCLETHLYIFGEVIFGKNMVEVGLEFR